MFSFTLFADDTNIFYKNTSPNQLLTITNNELTKLSLWLKAELAHLNISKTNYIVILKQKKKIKNKTIDILR